MRGRREQGAVRVTLADALAASSCGAARRARTFAGPVEHYFAFVCIDGIVRVVRGTTVRVRDEADKNADDWGPVLPTRRRDREPVERMDRSGAKLDARHWRYKLAEFRKHMKEKAAPE